MNISSKLDALHFRARKNIWLGYFAVFNRVMLALGFIPSGMQKVLGERFTVLPVDHPMGHFLDAFYQTGYYYTFVGLLQVTSAILLLIPRTALLGVLIYFPIILNICILSLSVRFDGSLVTSPLMVMACLYLLCWDYHKLKFILPFNFNKPEKVLPSKEELSKRFPFAFFSGVIATVFLTVSVVVLGHKIMPRNTMSECRKQCETQKDPDACMDFCDCIHTEGLPLYQCLDKFRSDQATR